MATNKNALIRYRVLDRCFRNPGKRYFIEDLISECEKVLLELDPDSDGISRRQILKDIAFMESKEGWQIELLRSREGKKVHFSYANPQFSINNMPLNELELHQLQSATNILSQFKGMPQFEWINEMIPKLKQGMSEEETTEAIIDFDSNQYLKGIEYLGELYNAIYYKKVLQISYQPYEAPTPFTLTLHPYFLKQYNNRWFLFGYNPEKEKYDWNLAIDRIVAINEIKDKYQKNTVIYWQEYFEDIIGVTKPEKGSVQNITLHFLNKTGKYMLSKPLHGSQRAKWLDDNTLEVKLKLIINYELERLVLSYADSVKVIKPEKLLHTVTQRLSNAQKNYNTNNMSKCKFR